MTKVGVKRELANGNDVCVTSTFPPKKPKEGYSHYQLRLLMFKEEGSDEWKLPRLRECFDPNECRLIMQLPTSLLVLSLQKGKKEGSTSTVQATKATHV
ncbi:unnamed protein product [Brassica oleracea]|uniref:(rape) hypothetical protein n=1 Tax=Brassica napus TaxID=3708 RepID=A0A816JH06_BRANA|nr:unnamed protein product [Brassica napus]